MPPRQSLLRLCILSSSQTLQHASSLGDACQLRYAATAALADRRSVSGSMAITAPWSPGSSGNSPSPSHAPLPRMGSRIPPFPGVNLRLTRDEVAAQAKACGLTLSESAIHGLMSSLRSGDHPPPPRPPHPPPGPPASSAARRQRRPPCLLSDPDALHDMLKRLAELPPQFPGFSLERQLQADAGAVLRVQPEQLREHMRVFQDLVPEGFPSVGQLMPALGSLISRDPGAAAAALHSLDRACRLHLGCPFPVARFTPSRDGASVAFVSLPAHTHAEAAFALATVLGPEQARRAVHADITLLGLPPIQVESVVFALRERLGVPLEGAAPLQALVASAPALLHRRPDWVRARLDALAARIASATGGGTSQSPRATRSLWAPKQQARSDEQGLQEQLREVVLAQPSLLVEPREAVAAERAGKAAVALRRAREEEAERAKAAAVAAETAAKGLGAGGDSGDGAAGEAK